MIAQLAAALILAGSSSGTQPDSVRIVAGDPWVSPDKAKHFLLAGFVESVTFSGLEATGLNRRPAFGGAIAVTAAVSLAREIHDERVKNQFSFRDLAWDFAGAAAAFAILRHTEHP